MNLSTQYGLRVLILWLGLGLVYIAWNLDPPYMCYLPQGLAPDEATVSPTYLNALALDHKQ